MRTHLCLLHQHVVVDVVDEPHVEDVVVAAVEEVLVARHVVPDDVVGLPAAEQREPRPQVQLHSVVHHLDGDFLVRDNLVSKIVYTNSPSYDWC